MANVANVDIYTSMLCGYCYRAKALLKKRNIVFNEIDVTLDIKNRREMIRRTGGRASVPQIFVNDAHIGGCEELVALERSGRLNSLLETA